MTARKTRKTTRKTRKKATPRRRRNAVARRPRRSAARSAPPPRRRRNPKGFFDQPATRYGGLAVGGAIGGAWINRNADLRAQVQPLSLDGKLWPSTVAAFVVAAGAWFFAKGKTRSNGIAVAFGLLVPQAQDYVSNMGSTSNGTGTSADAFVAQARQRRLARPVGKPSRARAAVTKHNRDLISA